MVLMLPGERHYTIAESGCDLDRGEPASTVVCPRPHVTVAEAGCRAQKRGEERFELLL